MEAFKTTLDLNCSRVCPISKYRSKPASRLFHSRPFSSSISCRKTPKFGVRLPQASDTRNCGKQSRNQGFVEVKEKLFKWIGSGVLGFAAAVSVSCDSPASAESITFAFPISHTPEVTDYCGTFFVCILTGSEGALVLSSDKEFLTWLDLC